MTLVPTTPRTIIRAFESRIEAITPTEQSGTPFERVRDEEVLPAQLRRFRILARPGVIDPGTPFGTGHIGYHFVLTVRVSYGGATEEDGELLADADAAAIYEHPTKGVRVSTQGTVGVDGIYAPTFVVPPPGVDGDNPYGLERHGEPPGDVVYDLHYRIHYLRQRAS